MTAGVFDFKAINRVLKREPRIICANCHSDRVLTEVTLNWLGGPNGRKWICQEKGCGGQGSLGPVKAS